MRPQTKKPPHGWIDKTTLAAVFDITTGAFDRGPRRFAAAEVVREIDGKIYFHARSVINAWAEAQYRAKTQPETDDALFADADSPNLERWRAAKADQEEMKRDQMRGDLIPRGELEPALLRFAPVLRRAGDNLARRFSNDAAAVLNEAVDEWELSVKRLLASTLKPATGNAAERSAKVTV